MRLAVQKAAAGDTAEKLATGLSMLGLAVSPAQQQQLLNYLALLAKWNTVYNLTAVRDIDDMVVVHLLDSLAIQPLVDRDAHGTMLDVGSGAGLPGIPIAITRPKLAVTTVDAVAKKIGFQQQVRSACDLDNLQPRHCRVEALTLDESPSLIVSRAFSSIRAMLESVDHLATSATTVVAMKGANPMAELDDLPAAWAVREVRDLDVPFLGAQRCAVVLVRSA